MRSMLLALLATPILGSPVKETLNAKVKEEIKHVNGTVEYSTMCKSCPYDLCPNVNIPWGGDVVTLTCWAEGDKVGDTKLWLKTTENCYISEYDLLEYQGDFRTDLKTCGKVPLTITKQAAKVRYLSECKWSYDTSGESMKYYGRDLDVTLTCWTEGGEVLNNAYWYKTTDNCHVSGSGLWGTPNRGQLDNCGPEPGPRINETKRSIEGDEARPVDLPSREDEEEEEERSVADDEPSLLRRWLQPEQIGEEYASCNKCPSATTNSTCPRQKRYEYNNTVVSQCFTYEDVTYPNGSFSRGYWLLTTDWCYVNGDDFWVPPWDNYRYPSCSHWPGYA